MDTGDREEGGIERALPSLRYHLQSEDRNWPRDDGERRESETRDSESMGKEGTER